MIYFVEQEKYRTECISIFFNFTDVLAGDTISGVGTITVTVFTGIDASPSLILYKLPLTSLGTLIEQKVYLGIPGTIYDITCSVTTVGGKVWEKHCNLAILPNDGNAVPSYQEIWETSNLYPYELWESLKGFTQLMGGTLRTTVFSYTDSLKGFTTFLGGTLLTPPTQQYTWNENLKGNTQIIGGTLLNPPTQQYTYYESLKGGIAVVGAILTPGSGINYTYYESLKGTTTVTGGTLA